MSNSPNPPLAAVSKPASGKTATNFPHGTCDFCRTENIKVAELLGVYLGVTFRLCHHCASNVAHQLAGAGEVTPRSPMDPETRGVVVKLEITAIQGYPKDWDEDLINFQLNEGSHCLSSEIDQLANSAAEVYDEQGYGVHDDEGGLRNTLCGCCWVEAEYVRDATDEDYRSQDLVVLAGARKRRAHAW